MSPAPWPVTAFTTVVTGSPALAAETVIATLANVSVDGASRHVQLDGWAAYTVGTSGTAARFRIRQNSLTGTLVAGADSGALTVIAANLRNDTVQGVDQPGDVAAFTYVLTMQVTGGAAASTVSSVFFSALITA